MAASRRPRTAGWDRRRRGWPTARWRAPAPRSTPGTGGRSQPTASAVILYGQVGVVTCRKSRAYSARAASGIELHALTNVLGEAADRTRRADRALAVQTLPEGRGPA